MSFSIDANSALSSALSGMQSSTRVLDRAANNISKMSVSSSERASQASSMPTYGFGEGVRETASFEPNLVKNMVDVMTSQTLYTANAKVVEAVDGTVGTALNMLV